MSKQFGIRNCVCRQLAPIIGVAWRQEEA